MSFVKFAFTEIYQNDIRHKANYKEQSYEFQRASEKYIGKFKGMQYYTCRYSSLADNGGFLLFYI